MSVLSKKLRTTEYFAYPLSSDSIYSIAHWALSILRDAVSDVGFEQGTAALATMQLRYLWASTQEWRMTFNTVWCTYIITQEYKFSWKMCNVEIEAERVEILYNMYIEK